MDGTITALGTIKGSLTPRGKLCGTLSGRKTIEAGLSLPDRIALDIYDGAYIVNPTFDMQVLPTQGKQMADDVEVKAIQVSTVSNLSGGNTVYIGGEINYG